ncbi:unnamed protein product [Arabis nemorensis]|uniref:IBR domain-containing protein n=1 Tax=Arabis nemorensis TaxID=586526 RepID=A0A565BMD1_9BRAS|nr:unnamed protein product [Arabis nemorensis]
MNHGIDILTIREEESLIDVAERVFCPSITCSALMAKRELLKHSNMVFLGAEEVGFRKCTHCEFDFCRNCRTKWHYNKTCDEFRKTKDYKTSPQGEFNVVAES